MLKIHGSMGLYLAVMLVLLASMSRADSGEPTKPECINKCLVNYYYNEPSSSTRADCNVTDTACICRDPVMPPSVGCCVADREQCGSGLDEQQAMDWLVYACGTYQVDIPSPLPVEDCPVDEGSSSSSVGVSSTTSTSMSETSSTESSSSASTTTTMDQSTLVPTGQLSSLPAETPPSSSQASSTPSSPSITTTTTATTTSSSSSTTTGASPPPPQTNTLPLGIGLGLGIPLSLSFIGLFFFLFWRSKRNSRSDHMSRSSHNKHHSNPFGNAGRPLSPVMVSDTPYYVAPSQDELGLVHGQFTRAGAGSQPGLPMREMSTWNGREGGSGHQGQQYRPYHKPEGPQLGEMEGEMVSELPAWR